MSRGSEEAETKAEPVEGAEVPTVKSHKADIELIMETLTTRGDIVDKLRDVLTN